MSNGNIIEYVVDDWPPLTDEQKAELEALEAMPDEDIDLSDMPEVTFDPANTRKTIDIPVDFDVYDWLRTKTYYYKFFNLNEVLRQAMLADKAAGGLPEKPRPALEEVPG